MERYRATMKEEDILKALRDYVLTQHGYLWHVRDARGQELEHLPDVIALLPARRHAPATLAFFEVKTQRDRVTPNQRHVIELADRVSEVVGAIIRPNPRNQRLEITLDEALELLGHEPWE